MSGVSIKYLINSAMFVYNYDNLGPSAICSFSGLKLSVTAVMGEPGWSAMAWQIRMTCHLGAGVDKFCPLADVNDL